MAPVGTLLATLAALLLAVASFPADVLTNRACASKFPIASPVERGRASFNDFFRCFRPGNVIASFLDGLVDAHPQLLRKVSVASTVQNATVAGYRLSLSESTDRPAIYVQSGLHAREWSAISSTIFALTTLLDDANAGSMAPAAFDWVFVPLVNVDGYEVSWTTNRLQRKNAAGVDLNRNYPSPYVNPSPAATFDEDYAGPAPWSEPETRGIKNFVEDRAFAGFVDVHSYGGSILLPYGDTATPHKDAAQYALLGRDMKEAMAHVNGSYSVQFSWELYVAYGGFQEYVARAFDKPSITIEMRGDDFIVPAATIVQRGRELHRGLVQFAKEIQRFGDNHDHNFTTAGRAKLN
ncbi:carboxypeptidase [Achlya hypogyna]|uniref:Carboxypeptidase n=1 Tax=Achlya hypogyna TaxID=1202772 RepID=A0A0A7CN59_ACHHY|nr:secreted protein [Achlya hypogyna]OQR93086.1 carboxypeptidase [Achlya hypogyna]